MNLSPGTVALTLAAPSRKVEAMWPLVLKALAEVGADDFNTQCAAAATINSECPGWVPIAEKHANKARQPKLWALQERYWPSGFFGRGLIQLTWLDNYRAAGLALGLDLVGHPELALDPWISARIFAWYFVTHGVAEAAKEGKWTLARMRVNGGNGVDVLAGGTTQGLNKFLAAVRALTASNTQPAQPLAQPVGETQ